MIFDVFCLNIGLYIAIRQEVWWGWLLVGLFGLGMYLTFLVAEMAMDEKERAA